MKREVLESMTKSELCEYAKAVGAEFGQEDPKPAIVEAALKRANRVIKVNAYGMHLEIEARRVNDLRNADADGGNMDAATLNMLARNILGDEQEKAVREYATDDDGCIDTKLYALIINKAAETASAKN